MKEKPRPQVIANFVMSADGKVATKSLEPVGFTSKQDRRRMSEIRSLADAIMVGRRTLEIDQMSMGLPFSSLRNRRIAEGKSAFPLRVVVTESGRLDPHAKMFRVKGGERVIFSTERMPMSMRRILSPKARIHWEEKIDLPHILEILYACYGVKILVCEGGATLFRSLLETGCVDEMYVTVHPRIFGGKKAPTLTGIPRNFLDAPVAWEWKDMKVSDGECFLHYAVKHRHPLLGRRKRNRKRHEQ